MPRASLSIDRASAVERQKSHSPCHKLRRIQWCQSHAVTTWFLTTHHEEHDCTGNHPNQSDQPLLGAGICGSVRILGLLCCCHTASSSPAFLVENPALLEAYYVASMSMFEKQSIL
jgi:hypothetical protein